MTKNKVYFLGHAAENDVCFRDEIVQEKETVHLGFINPMTEQGFALLGKLIDNGVEDIATDDVGIAMALVGQLTHPDRNADVTIYVFDGHDWHQYRFNREDGLVWFSPEYLEEEKV